MKRIVDAYYTAYIREVTDNRCKPGIITLSERFDTVDEAKAHGLAWVTQNKTDYYWWKVEAEEHIDDLGPYKEVS